MLIFGLVLIIICILAILLIIRLIRWLKTPTYWHQTNAGWYGTGHDKLTDKDKEHIRKRQEKKKNEK